MLPSSCNENNTPPKSLQELADVLALVGGRVNGVIKSNTLASFEKTNHSVFTPEEAAESQRFLLEASPMIDELKHAITTLTKFKNDLEQPANSCKRFVSAVGRLPVEILATIFDLAWPRYLGVSRPSFYPVAKGSYESIRKGFQISFNVAHVCRRWRGIALNMPRLWNTIHISGSQESLQKGILGQLEMLSRTASLSTFLVVGLPAAHHKFTQKCTKGYLSNFEGKCKGLDIYAVHDTKKNYSAFKYSKASMWLYCFNSLKKLTLFEVDLDNENLTPRDYDFHNLTHLHIRTKGGRDTEEFLSRAQLPSLTVLVLSLKGNDVDPGPFLERYSALTDFVFHGSISDTAGHFSQSRLRRLALFSNDQTNARKFLDLATPPSLGELTMPLYKEVEECLPEFTRRSKCRLTRLSFVNMLGHRSQAMERYYKALSNQINEKLGVPATEYDRYWENTRMVRELKASWYEPEYVAETEEEED